MEISVKKIGKLTLLKIYFIGLFIPLFLLGLVSRILFFKEFGAVIIYGNVLTGWEGLCYGILLSIGFSLTVPLFLWLLSLFGLWVYSLFSPIRIKFVEYKE